jgi:hypothetical protein
MDLNVVSQDLTVYLFINFISSRIEPLKNVNRDLDGFIYLNLCVDYFENWKLHFAKKYSVNSSLCLEYID